MRNRIRIGNIGLATCLLLASVSTSSADFPEQFPSYSDAGALREDSSLHAVAFRNPLIGIAVGDRGTILRTDDGGSTWKPKESYLECRLDDVVWLSDRRVVIVGGAYDQVTGISRGVVLTSIDGGQRWRRTDGRDLPRLRSVRIRSEDKSLVAIGDWAASSLSREFESNDGGKSWNSSGELEDAVDTSSQQLATEPSPAELLKWATATKINAPIRDACRIGSSTVFAVGDHGVIIRSSDGGKSWKHVRGEYRRTGVLFFAANAESVAWPMIGNEGLEHRNRVSLLLADDQIQSSDPAKGTPLDLCRQAATMLGAAAVDQISANRTTAESTTSSAKNIQRWISVHRPGVVVVDQSLPATMRATINEQAMAQRVRRIVSYSFTGRGDSMLHRSAMMPSIGVLASDFWQDALLLVDPGQTVKPAIALKRLYDADGDDRRGESVTSGLRPPKSQRLSAEAAPASRRQLQIVQARLGEHERIEKLVRESASADDFAAAVEVLLNQTAKPDQFRFAWNVLQHARRSASVSLRATALDKLANRFPELSAAKWASLRADSIRNSLEWKRLEATLSPSITNPVQAIATTEIVPVSPFQTASSRVAQASATTQVLVPRSNPVQVRKASAENEMQIDLSWEFHPLVLIARDAAKHRGDDEGLQATGQSANLQRLAENRRTGDWHRLLDPNRQIVAKAIKTPPRLDGKLDDPCWMHALTHPATQIAYDEDYIYVAMRTPAANISPDTEASNRSSSPRDHDLSQVDHLRLSIDTDRDLMTSMQFLMSDAGRTHDAIDGMRQFDPTWYIAFDRTETTLSFELAIQRRDVTDLPIAVGEKWFLSVEKISAGNNVTNLLPSAKAWQQVNFQ